jgi:AIR synthase-related protein
MTRLAILAEKIRASRGLAAKGDIAQVAARLGFDRAGPVPVGDDCAAIADGDGFLLLAIEGFIHEFVAADPWFAGWCGVMVNLSDVAAMGGRALAVVDALWAPDDERAGKILDGMRAASECYGVPIVGGHSNLSCDRGQLSVAILGRAQKLLTSFDARPGDRLVMAVDLRGAYRPPFLNWQAALDAPAERLRGDLALLPEIAEAGLARAGKDISQAGLVGTAAMLAECSGVGVEIDVAAIVRPEGVALDNWLLSFPSFGFLLAVAAEDVQSVRDLFGARKIAAAEIGGFNDTRRVTITDGSDAETIWNFAQKPLLGCAAPEGVLS